jgi:hypothetical protein
MYVSSCARSDTVFQYRRDMPILFDFVFDFDVDFGEGRPKSLCLLRLQQQVVSCTRACRDTARVKIQILQRGLKFYGAAKSTEISRSGT